MASNELPSLPSRIVQTFTRPGPLFEALRERPAWIGALLTMALVSSLAVGLIPLEAWEASIERQMREAGQEVPGTIPGGGIFQGIAVGGAFVMAFVVAFVLSGVTTVVFSFVLGDGGSFRQYLAVVSHAGLVQALGALVIVPLRTATLDPQLTLNVGTFLPFLPDGYLANVLRLLDLFGLWALVLVALGVSRIDSRRGWGAATAILLALNVVVVMVIGAFVP